MNKPTANKLLPLSLLMLLGSPATALRAGNVITMGYGEGAPGDTDIHVVVTATNDTPIHGYSLAFTYPAEALTCTEITLTGTHVLTEVGPEFIAPTFDNQLGIGLLGVIFAFDNPESIRELSPSQEGAFPRIIARITFSVKSDAPGGVYPLKLKDGIGTPASFNHFTSRGTSVAPRLIDGNFTVFGGNVLTLEKKLAFPGATPSLPIFAYVQHPEPLAGFQIAFTYEKAALTLPDLDARQEAPGIQNGTYNTTSLGFELGANKIEVFNFDIDSNFSATHSRAICAVLFDFLQPYDGQTLSPSTTSPPSQSIMKYTFQVEAAANAQKEWQDILLHQSNIPGLVDNRLIIGDRSLDPRLVHGKVYFSTGNLTGKIIDSATSTPVPGVKVVTDPDGFQATTDGGGNFRMTDVYPGQYTLLVSKVMQRPSYYSIRHFVTETGGDIVVTGKGLDNSVGSLPIYAIPTGGGTMLKPFLRAHVNADSRVDLSDAVFLLQWLFRGGEEPDCFQAADTNDDNRADLSDAVFLLNHLFAGGPQPAAPFSGTNTGCGPDPTPGGALDCQVSSCP